MPRSSRRLHAGYALPMLGALALLYTQQVSATPEVLSACPQWLDVDGNGLYWLSQHDDRQVRQLSLADGRLTKLGKVCSTSLSGSPIADRDALYCIDDNWQNLVRVDKKSGAKKRKQHEIEKLRVREKVSARG